MGDPAHVWQDESQSMHSLFSRYEAVGHSDMHDDLYRISLPKQDVQEVVVPVHVLHPELH